jgi:DNA-binding MarR family transcriptional regulator
MSEPLTALFDTVARIRLLRMFVFNPSLEIGFQEVLRRAKLSHRAAKTELSQLERAGLLRRKFIFETMNGKRRKVLGYTLDRTSPIVQSLQTFLYETAPINGKNLLKHLRGVGKVQVLVAAGAFIREFDRRLDVLVAVEKLNPSKIEHAIRNLEAELGLEIKYAAFTTSDLRYRIGMHDKLIRDVFDYPHEMIVDKVHIRDEIRRR